MACDAGPAVPYREDESECDRHTPIACLRAGLLAQDGWIRRRYADGRGQKGIISFYLLPTALCPLTFADHLPTGIVADSGWGE